MNPSDLEVNAEDAVEEAVDAAADAAEDTVDESAAPVESFEEVAETLISKAEDEAEVDPLTAAVSDTAGEGEEDGEQELSPFAAALAAALQPEPEPEAEPESEAEIEVPEEAAVEEAEEPAAEAEAEEEEEEEPVPVSLLPASPYDLPGGWYVIHSYSGYENKVKANLETRIHSMHMEESIFDVVIPMEDVVEFKGGRKVTVLKKQFPGYLLVRMYMDDDSWSVVRNTPGVTGFVGSAARPTPLSRREVERILGVRKDEEEKKAPRFKPEWEVGETVRVVEGPFADFNGVIEDINVDQSKVRVLVDIFGRETPVELNFEQIQKF
jgi:transcriptional antiterminator NusG